MRNRSRGAGGDTARGEQFYCNYIGTEPGGSESMTQGAGKLQVKEQEVREK